VIVTTDAVVRSMTLDQQTRALIRLQRLREAYPYGVDSFAAVRRIAGTSWIRHVAPATTQFERNFLMELISSGGPMWPGKPERRTIARLKARGLIAGDKDKGYTATTLGRAVNFYIASNRSV
jgi:hypothetical protein